MRHFSFFFSPSVSKVCPPCDNELKADNIMEHYCASDFGKYSSTAIIKKNKNKKKSGGGVHIFVFCFDKQALGALTKKKKKRIRSRYFIGSTAYKLSVKHCKIQTQ